MTRDTTSTDDTVATSTDDTVATSTDDTVATSTDDTVATSTDDGGETDDTGKKADVEPTEPPFRTVFATVITILTKDKGEVKPSRSHKRAVVSCDTEGTLEVIDENGVVETLEDVSTSTTSTTVALSFFGPGLQRLLTTDVVVVGPVGFGGLVAFGVPLQEANVTSTATTTETVATTTDDAPVEEAEPTCSGSGDDLILLTKKKGRGSNELVIVAKQQTDKITERLERLSQKLKDSGKISRIAGVQERTEERNKKEDERLQKALDRADDSLKRDLERAQAKKQDHASKSEDRAKQRREDEEKGKGSSGDKGKGSSDDKGKGASDDKGKK